NGKLPIFSSETRVIGGPAAAKPGAKLAPVVLHWRQLLSALDDHDQRLGGAEFSRNGTSLAPPGSTRERLRKLSGSDVEGLQETKGMGYSNRRQSSMLL